jgi:hypothetical protein
MTDVRITSAAAPVDSQVMASADQVTIVGNGTSEDPLRAVGGVSAVFDALVVGSDPQVGLVVLPLSPVGDARRVTAASAQAVGGPGRQVVGVVTSDLGGGLGRVQAGGFVRLSEDEWDLVSGESGGLVRGTVYYLSTTDAGHVVPTKPVGSGEFVVQVGVALSPTTMITSTPSTVAQNP